MLVSISINKRYISHVKSCSQILNMTGFIVMSYYLDTVLYQFMLHDLIIKRG